MLTRILLRLRVRTARRLCRSDGRTFVVAVRRQGSWHRLPESVPLDEVVVRQLRKQRVQQVRLRRGLRRGKVPLQWIPPRTLDEDVERLLRDHGGRRG
jgi:hypothetical protein